MRIPKPLSFAVPRRGFTLIEVMIASAVGAMLALSIMAGIVYNIKAHEVAREQNQATRLLSRMLEEVRFTHLSELRQVDPKPFVLDDNGTPDYEPDDLRAEVGLRLWDAVAGTPLLDAGNNSVQLVLVEATATWNARGKERSCRMVTHIARSPLNSPPPEGDPGTEVTPAPTDEP